jgi:hypothetical protein
MLFANDEKKKLRFHINGDRVEQRGETVIKNLRNLFAGTKHELVEHNWMEHAAFVNLVAQMDVGMQVSLSETFNIIAADFVANDIPVIGSNEINWLSRSYRASLTDYHDIYEKLAFAYFARKYNLHFLNKMGLKTHNRSALKSWLKFLD